MREKIIRTYTELSALKTFEERYQYVLLNGTVSERTFGSFRWMNQKFYTSREWRAVRNRVIVRDNGCDLGISGLEIHGKILVHHLNPITPDDIINRSKFLLDPEYLICTSFDTHEALTYAVKHYNPYIGFCERTPNDTCPWR